MRIRHFLFIALGFYIAGCGSSENREEVHKQSQANNEKRDTLKAITIVSKGKQPFAAIDDAGVTHVTFAEKDAIYLTSAENNTEFSDPMLVDSLNALALGFTRGPKLAISGEHMVITAAQKGGNLYSWSKKQNNNNWNGPVRINDIDSSAKETFVNIAPLGEGKAFAVWLDMRGNNKNKVFGSLTTDGGQTWEQNKLIYESPDTTVCECCNPTVTVGPDNLIYIMFRNWLNGSRDMHLTYSDDEGKSFSEPVKLGEGTWPLNACPMDGGGVAISNNGKILTSWRRADTIFTSSPGQPELPVAQGKNSYPAFSTGKKYLIWQDWDGNITTMLPESDTPVILGPGTEPMLVSSNEHVIAIWQNDQGIAFSWLK